MCCKKINGKNISLEKNLETKQKGKDYVLRNNSKGLFFFYLGNSKSGVFLPLGGFAHRREVLHS